MKRLGVLYSGSYPEQRITGHPHYRRWLSDLIYLPEIANSDLSRFDGLIIPEGTHHGKLHAAAGQLTEFLNWGGTVAMFGDQPIAWLPSLNWEFRVAHRPEPGEIVVVQPEHSFHRYVRPEDIWHHHGIFHPPPESETLLATPDGGGVLYIQHVADRGRLIVSATDLFVHAATTGNPISQRFLNGFLPWLAEEDPVDHR